MARVMPVALIGPDAPWITVAAAIELALITIWFARLGPPARLRALTGTSMPELRWHYTAADLSQYVAPPSVRKLYTAQLQWDFLFIVLYGAGFAFLVDGTWGRLLADHSKATQLVPLLLPGLLAASDVGEDLNLLAFLKGDETASVVHRASQATVAKKLLTWVVGAECILGLILLATLGPNSV